MYLRHIFSNWWYNEHEGFERIIQQKEKKWKNLHARISVLTVTLL